MVANPLSFNFESSVLMGLSTTGSGRLFSTIESLGIVAEVSAAIPEPLRPSVPSLKCLPSYRLFLLVIKRMRRHPMAMPMRKSVIEMPATAPPPSMLLLLVLPELLEVVVTPRLVDDEEGPEDVTVGLADEEGTSIMLIIVNESVLTPGPNVVVVPSGIGTTYSPEVTDKMTVVIVDNIFKF